MLLVMDTANIFVTADGMESRLWQLTWDKIDTFLPHLRAELFKPFEAGGSHTETHIHTHTHTCTHTHMHTHTHSHVCTHTSR